MNALRVTGIMLLLAIAVVVMLNLVSRTGPKPAPRDFVVQHRAIAKTLMGGDRDETAWREFEKLAVAFDAWRDAFEARYASEGYEAFPSVQLRYAYPEVSTREVEHNADPTGSAEMLDAYIASDIPRDIGAALALDGLFPESIMLQEDAAFAILNEHAIRGRQLAIAEGSRMRRALERSDEAVAFECAQNIDKLSRLVAGQPCILMMRIEQITANVLVRQLTAAMEQDDVRPSLATGLLPLLVEAHRAEPERTRLYLQADEVYIQRAIAMLYAGEVDREELRVEVSRNRWLSHLDTATRFADHMRDAATFAVEGPGRETMPAIPWDESTEQGIRRAAPLSYLLPGMERLLTEVFERRVERARLIIRLAILVHTAEHARPPAALGELVERGILDELPTDPFALDGAFGYRVDPDVPGGYVLEDAR